MRCRKTSAPGYLLAAFLPVTLLFSLALFLALWTHSPWQSAIAGSGYFLCLVIPCLLAGEILPSEQALVTAAALALLVVSAWGAGALALAHRLGWALAWAPAVYLLLASILWARGQMLTRARRVAVWVACGLLIAVIYVSDLTGFWWELIVASLLTLAGLGLILRRYPLRRRYIQARATYVLYTMTILAILLALAVGGLEVVIPRYIPELGALPGLAAAAITSVIGAVATRQTRLRTRIALWSAVTCLMLLVVAIAALTMHSAWWEILAACGAVLLALCAAFLARMTPLQEASSR